MFTDTKVTGIYCLADDFCKFFDSLLERYSLEDISSKKKRKYHRDPKMSKAEIMLILIMFHASGYRCLKHYYLQYVCVHLRSLFPHYPCCCEECFTVFPKFHFLIFLIFILIIACNP